MSYPVLETYIRVPTMGGPRALPEPDPSRPKAFGYVTDAGTYELSVTRPLLFRDYLHRQVTELVKNHQPVLRVRYGHQNIPIHFAFDANAEGEVCPGFNIDPDSITPDVTALLPVFFDVPKLADIDDVANEREVQAMHYPSLEYINLRCFRDQEGRLATQIRNCPDEEKLGCILDEEKKERVAADQRLSADYAVNPLSLFTAPRLDYSLGRIKHYTKTSPAHFQNFIVFTNYAMYMEEFVKYAGSQLLLAAMSSVTWIERQGPDAARISAFMEALFKEFDGGEEQPHRNLRRIVDEAGPGVLTMPADSMSRPLQISVGDVARSIGPDDFVRARYLKEAPVGPDVAFDAFTQCMRLAAERVTFAGVVPIENEEAEGRLDQAALKERRERLRPLENLLSGLLRKVSVGLKENGLLAPKSPQMPAYHWEKPGSGGITMVNIGVGPSNAKTISDHLAVLRPHVFLMLGHCGGLRATQRLGHYVLANGYVRVDGVLDRWLPKEMVIPPIDEIDASIKKAFHVLKHIPADHEKRARLRTGTVATVMDRNWELRYPQDDL